MKIYLINFIIIHVSKKHQCIIILFNHNHAINRMAFIFMDWKEIAWNWFYCINIVPILIYYFMNILGQLCDNIIQNSIL